MTVEEIVDNPYASPRIIQSRHFDWGLLSELLIPGYALANGLYHDLQQSQQEDIPFDELFRSNFANYCAVEFSKLYILTVCGISLYIFYQ
ncbi:MAG: hypothetical protein AABX16_03940 [Nanoarchaeota archaeon]